jgi:hypothetical protein
MKIVLNLNKQMSTTKSTKPTQYVPNPAVSAKYPDIDPSTKKLVFHKPIDLTRLTNKKPEKKSAKSDKTVEFITMDTVFNYKSGEGKFSIEFPECIAAWGLNTKVNPATGRVERNVCIDMIATPEFNDLERLLDMNYLRYCDLLDVVKDPFLPNFMNSQDLLPNGDKLSSIVFKEQLKYSKHKETQKPDLTKPRQLWVKVPPFDVFTTVSGKLIPNDALKGVSFKYIPCVAFDHITINGGKASVNGQIVSAVVTSPLEPIKRHNLSEDTRERYAQMIPDYKSMDETVDNWILEHKNDVKPAVANGPSTMGTMESINSYKTSSQQLQPSNYQQPLNYQQSTPQQLPPSNYQQSQQLPPSNYQQSQQLPPSNYQQLPPSNYQPPQQSAPQQAYQQSVPMQYQQQGQQQAYQANSLSSVVKMAPKLEQK